MFLLAHLTPTAQVGGAFHKHQSTKMYAGFSALQAEFENFFFTRDVSDISMEDGDGVVFAAFG